jgi:hypothetical protein
MTMWQKRRVASAAAGDAGAAVAARAKEYPELGAVLAAA